jgi:hypothetical protein
MDYPVSNFVAPLSTQTFGFIEHVAARQCAGAGGGSELRSTPHARYTQLSLAAGVLTTSSR